MRFLVLIPFLFLLACGPKPGVTQPFQVAPLPQIDGYLSAVPAGKTEYGNDSLAEVFVHLTHYSENGTQRSTHYRFEGPVTVSMTGEVAAQYQGFLTSFLDRIARQTGIDIAPVRGGGKIVVRFIADSRVLSAAGAQCVVVFGRPNWNAFLLNPKRYTQRADDAPSSLDNVTVFIPSRMEPYKIRECLIEEITQALGTSNDIYGLGPTIFNDDDGHMWPTKLDYLMLRVLYDPAMPLDATLEEAEASARKILARLNPAGERAAPLPPTHFLASLEWRRSVQTLRKNETNTDRMLEIAQELVVEARKFSTTGALACVAESIRAQIHALDEETRANAVYYVPIRTCSAAHGADDVRVAKLEIERAQLLADQGDHEEAVEIVDEVLPIAAAHGQEELIFQGLGIQAIAAIELKNRSNMLSKLQDANAWLAYAAGADNETVGSINELLADPAILRVLEEAQGS